MDYKKEDIKPIDNEELDPNIPHVEPEPVTEHEAKKKNALKYLLNISIILIITIVALVVSLWGDNFRLVMDNLARADWRWLLAIFGVMAVSIFIKALIDVAFARLYVRRYSVISGILVDQIDMFYSGVTPGATGGQVMVSYTLKKQGVPISSAVSMVAMMSIVYQITIVIYGMLAFIVKYQEITQIGGIDIRLGDWAFQIPMMALTILGFILNMLLISVIFMMAYWKGFHHFMLGPCISLLAKLHLVKDPNKTREGFRIQVENFKIEFKKLLTNIPFTILAFFLYFAFFTVRFSIPYFCGLALGNQSVKANFWDAVFMSNYHQMVTNLIPIPGSAGISEYIFSKLFVGSASNPGFYAIFDNLGVYDAQASYGLATSSMLLWRTVTFTIPLITGGLTAAFYKPNKDAKGKNDPLSNYPTRQTFLTLQQETYLERKDELERTLATRSLSKDAIMKNLRAAKKNQNIPSEDDIITVDLGKKHDKKHTKK